MTRFNLQIRTQEKIWETIAVEREDLTGLRIEVARSAGELLRDHADKIWADEDWRIDATDEQGLNLFFMHIFASDTAATTYARR